MLLFLLLTPALSGCARGYDEWLTDVSYETASMRQTMDIALPRHSDDTPSETTAFLFVHGGSWQSGDKGDYAQLCKDFAKNGYVCATMNYRFIGDGARCGDMLDDIDAALKGLKAQASAHNINVKDVVLVGGSAGGHLALLYSYSRGDASPLPIKLCVGLAAITDFSDHALFPYNETGQYFLDCAAGLSGHELSFDITANEQTLRAISPISYVSPNAPPTILAHGMRDELVPYSNALRLEQALTENGVPVSLFSYDHSGHDLADDAETDRAFWAAVLAAAER